MLTVGRVFVRSSPHCFLPRRRVHSAGTEQFSRAVIHSIVQTSNTVKTVRLKSKSQVCFHPGQWIDFCIPRQAAQSLLRPGEDYLVGGFSLTSTPREAKEEGKLEIMVKNSENRPVQYIHKAAKVGDEVLIRPGGSFFCHLARVQNETVLLISGGIGVTPFLSMLRTFKEACDDGVPGETNIFMMHTAKEKSDLVVYDELVELCASQHQIRCHFSLTKPHPKESLTPSQGITVGSGRIDREFLQRSLNTTKGTMCFICGPPAMVTEVAATLKAMGVPSENVRSEQWW